MALILRAAAAVAILLLAESLTVSVLFWPFFNYFFTNDGREEESCAAL